jgi:hypothetical protein
MPLTWTMIDKSDAFVLGFATLDDRTELEFDLFLGVLPQLEAYSVNSEFGRLRDVASKRPQIDCDSGASPVSTKLVIRLARLLDGLLDVKPSGAITESGPHEGGERRHFVVGDLQGPVGHRTPPRAERGRYA